MYQDISINKPGKRIQIYIFIKELLTAVLSVIMTYSLIIIDGSEIISTVKRSRVSVILYVLHKAMVTTRL